MTDRSSTTDYNMCSAPRRQSCDPRLSSSQPTQYLIPGMSHLPQSTSPLQSTERISQGTISLDPQQRRCASFNCYSCQLLSKHGWPPTATAHILRPSTSSTTIYSFTYFFSIGRAYLIEMRLISILSLSQEGRGGTANDGGINSHTFAKDGES
jgi:hypothetical protein